jgi:uncharacterized protein involved in outer membrane biogenesis
LKTFRKILFYLSLACGVLLLSLTIIIFLFQDKIINQFIREANKQLNTPVKIGKIEVSVWRQFPKLSIVMRDVYVEDSHPGQYPLLTAQEVSFQLNLMDVWNENYIIHGLQIRDSETNLKINATGQNNYTIAKSTGKKDTGAVSFELDRVKLTNTRVHYTDLSAAQEHTFTSKDLIASIQSPMICTQFLFPVK